MRPDGARLLGGTELDPNQAFAVGDRAWGVQFHPEFDADVMRGYVDFRRGLLADEGLDPDALRGAVVETPASNDLLARFARLAAERRPRFA